MNSLPGALAFVIAASGIFPAFSAWLKSMQGFDRVQNLIVISLRIALVLPDPYRS
jgi:hypothetical protein